MDKVILNNEPSEHERRIKLTELASPPRGPQRAGAPISTHTGSIVTLPFQSTDV